MKSLYRTFTRRSVWQKRACFGRLCLLLCFLLPTSHAIALDYYWVGGSGLWSEHNTHWATASGGAVFRDQVPTSMDNVHFDANSFPAGGTVTIDQTIIYCMDMDWTGAGNAPVFTGPGDKQVWIYGSLTLVAGMQWGVLGEVHFRAFQLGKTITSAGKGFLTRVYFDGTGGGWTLLDAFKVNQALLHTNGALYTNGQDVTVNVEFASISSPTRTLNFGSSNIYIGEAGSGFTYFQVGSEPFNFDAGTSTIYMKGVGAFYNFYFDAGNHTYYNLVCDVPTNIYGNNNFHAAIFLKSAKIYGNNHYDNLTFTTGQLYELAAGSTQTINPGGAFNGNGSCMDFLTVVSQSAGSAAQIEKANGTVALSYVVLQDIHAIGGATFNAANSADLGNNTGWAFLPAAPRNLYWVSGGGNWNDAAHWSLASGGIGGECIPTPFDNVFFDQNAGFTLPGEQVNINVPVAFCQDMDWAGVLNSPALTGESQNKMFIFGSLKFVSGMTLTFFGEVHFMAHTTGKTITSAGKGFLTRVYFDGTGGGWTLLDAFKVNQALLHTNGALYTNGQDVTVNVEFASISSPTRTLNFGSSNIYIGEAGSGFTYFQVGSEPFNFDAGTSTIYMKGVGAFYNFYFDAGNHTYYNLVCDVPTNIYGNNNFHAAIFLKSAKIYGNNHYDNLTFTTGQLYELAAGSTQTINPGGAFNGNGSCMDFLTVVSQSAGSAAQIEKANGTVALSYVVLQDIHAIGGATFNAANSADLGNNTGWAFLSAPRNLYWVSGGGNWNDAAHWSLASGGIGGECIPTPFDNVFFDQNAGFTLPGEQVNINVPVAFCQDMDWAGVLNSPALTGESQNKMFIFGSLKFVSGMTLTFFGEVHFMAHTTGKTITSAGKGFLTRVYFDGTGGGWTLLDAFKVNQALLHTNGALYTNGQDVTVNVEFASISSPTRTLNFGSSNIYIGEAGSGFTYFQVGSEPFNFDAGTSTIYMKGVGAFYNFYFDAGNHTYYNLVCDVPTNIYGNNNFHAATFLKSAKIGTEPTWYAVVVRL